MHNNNEHADEIGSARHTPIDQQAAPRQAWKGCPPFWPIFSIAISIWAISASADEKFFNTVVAPQLAQNQCAICHVTHHVRPRVFEYRELLPYLAMGTSAENNVLIAKMTNARHLLPNVASHPGGQRCDSIESEPCATFRKWWKEEFN